MSVSEDISSYSDSSTDPPDLALVKTTKLSVSDLENRMVESLEIKDDPEPVYCLVPSSGRNGIINESGEDDHKGSYEFESGSFMSKKILSKCATFPCSVKGDSSPESSNGSEVHDNGSEIDVSVQNRRLNSSTQPYQRSLSLSTPSKLVSAMKGSREKQGKPSMKLSVTWAADVYDPTPTAVSHVVSSKNHRHRNDSRKNGKNKQRGGGKSSRGGKGKDKKQSRKYNGNSSRAFKHLDGDERVIVSSDSQAAMLGFNVGNPDPFCGSSFLKTSVTQLHFSVAEAT